MRFIPHTARDVERMLATIGVAGVEDLFAGVPASLRKRASLDLPGGLPESEVLARLSALADRNRPCGGFLGAGSYDHFVPEAVSAVLRRGEFATAYTPYQPEVSQGTLQASFEFQTYVAILMGMEVANASLYDGASAFAEAALMALRLRPKRDELLVSAALHPEYVEVLRTYLEGHGRGRVVEVPIGRDGRTDLRKLEAALGERTAAVCVGYPSFFGVIEDLGNAARLARRAEALTISVTTEALALALLRAPGNAGADIAVAEGQSLGLPMSYGGPGVGLFATRREFVRQMPGRLAGETVDETGRRGYVLTLSTREQHIRRDRATSNICTNQGLAALAVTVYLGLAGRRGLRALAELNTVRAHQVAARLEREAGVGLVHSAPFFNEFVVAVPGATEWLDAAAKVGLIAGLPLARVMVRPREMRDRVLITVTETNTNEQVDLLVKSLVERKAA